VNPEVNISVDSFLETVTPPPSKIMLLAAALSQLPRADLVISSTDLIWQAITFFN
jgi:hypothetical protein